MRRPARHVLVARLAALTAAAIAVASFALPAAAHAGGLSLDSEPVSVPAWLFLLTGGGVVAASFLLTSFVTDRELLSGFHERSAVVALSPTTSRPLRAAGAAAGLLGLAAVVVVGLTGPAAATRNLAVLLVWVGWWAGFAMTTYLIGNSWPVVNPFRTLAARLPAPGTVTLPARLGTWPSVVGLLVLVWVEVVSDLSSDPRLLATVVVAYGLLTVGGAMAAGPSWFTRVDPVARVFRFYGRVAPIQRTDEGVTLVVPGAALVEAVDSRGRLADDDPLVDGPDDVAFVIALLWVTSFDGLVSTPAWSGVLGPVVRAGVPARLAYLFAMLVGFALFLGVYWGASRLVRRTAQTYLSSAAIAARFAPALLPIAAGYHLAHYAPYFLRLAPALGSVLLSPVAPPATPPSLGLPGWFGAVGPVAILLGHVLAVWVAHASAFESFTGRLQPIRSQYPFVLVMVAYTMTSLWLLAQPYADPPFL